MVIWTPRARADLKAIHDYIAKDSRQNAQRVVREILRKGDTLAEPPRPGRTVPEVNDPDLREIPAYSWRILYHLRNDGTVFIVTLHPQAPSARCRRPPAGLRAPERLSRYIPGITNTRTRTHGCALLRIVSH